MSTITIPVIAENVNLPNFAGLSDLLGEMAREAKGNPKKHRADLEESFRRQREKIRKSVEGLPPDALRRMREEVRTVAENIKPQVVLASLAAIKPKAIVWLWQDRIPACKLSIFAGDPGVGKSSVCFDLISRFTTGRAFPDGTPPAPIGDVLILSAEDDPADTIRPRLEAAGADIARVHLLQGVPQDKGNIREFSLDVDLPRLTHTLAQNPSIKLIVVDPLSSYLGAKSINREQEVRQVLVPLRALAESLGVTVIVVAHLSKRADTSALHRVSGAVALTGVARSAWLFCKDPEGDSDGCLMLRIKNNLSRKTGGLHYSFSEVAVGEGISAPRIEWGRQYSGDADHILNMDSEEKAAKRAEKFLTEYLADGAPHSSNQITEAAKQKGIPRSGLFEAKKELPVKVERKAGAWYWSWSAPTSHEAF